MTMTNKDNEREELEGHAKKLAGFEVQMRLGIIALSGKAEDSENQDAAMKYSQAALNLSNAIAVLRRIHA